MDRCADHANSTPTAAPRSFQHGFGPTGQLLEERGFVFYFNGFSCKFNSFSCSLNGFSYKFNNFTCFFNSFFRCFNRTFYRIVNQRSIAY